MVDAESMAMQSVKVDPGNISLDRFSRVPGAADGGSAPLAVENPAASETRRMQESVLVGLRAMMGQESPPAVVEKKTPVRAAPAKSVPKKALHEGKTPIVEVGDCLQSVAFSFVVRVQEHTEDGGFIGRAPGVGRIRVRADEVKGYQRVGKSP